MSFTVPRLLACFAVGFSAAAAWASPANVGAATAVPADAAASAASAPRHPPKMRCGPAVAPSGNKRTNKLRHIPNEDDPCARSIGTPFKAPSQP